MTSICSGGRPNSQRASITSSALFISVAESTVIFGPIRQVGCRSASSTVTSASSRGLRPRNGPPLAVSTTRSTSSGRPPCSAWKMALCSLSTGRTRPPRARGQVHDQRPGHDQRFLVGHGDGLAGFQGRPGARQPRRADDGRHHDVHFRVGHQPAMPSAPRSSSVPAGKRGPSTAASASVSTTQRGRKRSRLLRQHVPARVGAEADDRQPVPGRCWMTSRALVPMEPVEPRTTTRRKPRDVGRGCDRQVGATARDTIRSSPGRGGHGGHGGIVVRSASRPQAQPALRSPLAA